MCGCTSPNWRWKAGPTGLDAIARLLGQLPVYLRAEGLVALEIGYDQGPAVLALLDQRLPQAHAWNCGRTTRGTIGWSPSPCKAYASFTPYARGGFSNSL